LQFTVLGDLWEFKKNGFFHELIKVALKQNLNEKILGALCEFYANTNFFHFFLGKK
jgi:hypothetical protein